MDHCQECGETCAIPSDLIGTDVGPIHKGACYKRFILAQDAVAPEQKLWAALELWDLQVPVLVRIVRAGKPTLGVIVNHHPKDGWSLEDQGGELHRFPSVESVEVIEDAFAA
jgi:hypothetical protein